MSEPSNPRRIHLLSERVDCWPCHLKRCPLDFRCMRRLTPERVLEAGLAVGPGRLRQRIRVLA